MAASTDPVLAAVSSAMASDPNLQAAAAALAQDAIEQARWFLRHGSPTVKLQVIRTIMPALSRQFTTSDDSSAATLRLEMQRVMSEVRGDAAIPPPPSPPALAPAPAIEATSHPR